MLPMVIAKRQRSTIIVRILIPFNSTHKHVPFPACFSRHVRTTSLPMLSFSEAGRLHQEKNTRDAGHSSENLRPHRMTFHPAAKARRTTGWLSEPPRWCRRRQKKTTIDNQPIRQAQLVGQEALGPRLKRWEGGKTTPQSWEKNHLRNYNEMSLISNCQGGYYLATHEPLERCHLAVYGLILHFPKQTQKSLKKPCS